MPPQLPQLAPPLHVMLSKPSTRKLPKEIMQHVFKGETPAGSFVKAKEGHMVSTPEFCFLQLANQLPLPRLIQLGYELCGVYSIPLAGDTKVPKCGFYKRKPLTNVRALLTFVERIPGVNGHKNALLALRYILDGSASPMETKLAMLLTLPYNKGGYGFFFPKLNYRITPSKAVKKSASKDYYECDLFWPDYDLAVEYDSDAHHTGKKNIAADSKKRNALALMGITVITVTKEQIYSRTELEKVARILANHLDKRLYHSRNSGFAAAHFDLHSLLLPIKETSLLTEY
ncbi:MAG: endonuclease domain-containing protein [Coriobacteriia bacterium]|nr:endonuclease domain-containing protein [Coriobacteriia bacterium]